MSTVTVVENHLRPFSKSDWYGWAGAVPFPEGGDREPLISYTVYGVLIVDAVGVAIYTTTGDEKEDKHFHWDHKLRNQRQAYIITHGITLRFLAAQSTKDLEVLARRVGCVDIFAQPRRF